jgi:hypothetical protein
MTKRLNDSDLNRISGGTGFHVTPEPDPGTIPSIPPSIGTSPSPGGPGPGPEAEGNSSGYKDLTK